MAFLGLVLAPCHPALAQSAAPVLPGGGIQIHEIPAAPSLPRSSPQLRLDPVEGSPPPAPGTASIPVQRIVLSGVTLFSEAELLDAAGFKPGGPLTLAELRTLANRMAAHYHRHGYVFARAVVPPQEVQAGTVTIALLEGRYGSIRLRNESTLDDAVAHSLLSNLASGDPIAIAPLERSALLLADLPGVNVRSTLVPGSTVGTSDLLVEVTPGRRVSGSIDADNHGNRYTGAERVGLAANYSNPTGRGDTISVRGLTSGSGLSYGRASYQSQLGAGRAGIAFSALGYSLGREFASLRANGTAQVATLYGSYPLVRSRTGNLNAGLAYDAKRFEDRVDSSSTVTDKALHVVTASLSGDARDSWGGPVGYALTLSVGNLDIRSPAALAADDAGARTQGHYRKAGFSVSGQRPLAGGWSLQAGLNGQFTNRNLDASEKMILGGANGVRAYPTGEAVGDEGYLLNLEARYVVPQAWSEQDGKMRFVGFLDHGAVRFSKQALPGASNRRYLTGVGLGLQWNSDQDLVLRASVARKLGSEVATSAPDKGARIWLQVAKFL